jgi:nicotinamide mononucleotide transporter
MHDLIDFLNQVVFTLHGTPVMASELVGFVLGVWTVWLVARNNIWTFPIGIVQSAFFFVLFLEASLYADMWLQVFFIVVQVFGWWAWLKAGPNRTKLVVNTTPPWLWAILALLLGAFVYFMVPVLHQAHGAYPLPDATTSGLSVLAQFMLSFKLIENWYLWIVADLIYIPLYFVKDLYFTSILYVVFLGLCVMGLVHWSKVRAEQPQEALTAPPEAYGPMLEGSRPLGGLGGAD